IWTANIIRGVAFDSRSRRPELRRGMRLALTLFATIALLVAHVHAQGQLRARVYASGFTTPIAFVQDPLDPAVQFVVEQAGRIRIVRNGTVLSSDFLNLTATVRSGGEQGLLGMAFAPDAASGRFYVNFTNAAGDTVVA